MAQATSSRSSSDGSKTKTRSAKRAKTSSARRKKKTSPRSSDSPTTSSHGGDGSSRTSQTKSSQNSIQTATSTASSSPGRPASILQASSSSSIPRTTAATGLHGAVVSNGWFLSDAPHGLTEEYVAPQPGRFYVAAADIGGGRGGGDFSVLEIWDYHSLEQCLEFRGEIPPDLFADLIDRHCQYCNWSFVAPEVNSEGRSTIDRLAHVLNYPRLYHSERTDSISHKVNFDRPGWHTNSKTKGPIISNLARHIRNRSIRPHSRKLIEELQEFVYDPTARGSMRYRAAQGRHDDLVMATAICLYARDSWQCQPPERAPQDIAPTRTGRLLLQLDEDDDAREDSWLLTG